MILIMDNYSTWQNIQCRHIGQVEKKTIMFKGKTQQGQNIRNSKFTLLNTVSLVIMSHKKACTTMMMVATRTSQLCTIILQFN